MKRIRHRQPPMCLMRTYCPRIHCCFRLRTRSRSHHTCIERRQNHRIQLADIMFCLQSWQRCRYREKYSIKEQNGLLETIVTSNPFRTSAGRPRTERDKGRSRHAGRPCSFSITYIQARILPIIAIQDTCVEIFYRINT